MSEENTYTWRAGQPGVTGTDPLSRFTDRARKVVELSLREALQLGHSEVETEHILLALVRNIDETDDGGNAVKALGKLGLTPKAIRTGVFEHLRSELRSEMRASSAKQAGPFTDNTDFLARQAALKQAIEYGPVQGEGLLETAQSFYDFLTGETS